MLSVRDAALACFREGFAVSAQRSRASLIVRSFLGAIWFAAWFFVIFPGLVLWASDSLLPPPLGPRVALGVSLILLALTAVGGGR